MAPITLKQIQAEFEEAMNKNHPCAPTVKVLKRATKVKKIVKTERPTKGKR